MLMGKIAHYKKASSLFIILLSGLIAYLDSFTPPEVPVDAFYALPIWLGLLTFGLLGGLGVATSSIILFFLSNYILAKNGINNDHPIWFAVLLSYLMYLAFSYGAYRFLLNQRQLDKTRAALQARLEELNELYQQSEKLHQENLKLVVTEERNRLAREIHDVLAQGFTAIILQVEAALLNPQDSSSVEMRLAQINELAHHNLQEARRSVANLRPLPLDDSSLYEALERIVREFNAEQQCKATFASSGEVRFLPVEIETALLRITQEALSNVVRHARASTVQVTLDYDEEEVCLTVQDNGKGFEVLTASNGGKNGQTFGLSTMQERARLIGGWTTIQSSLGEGCRVRVIVPYNKARDGIQILTVRN
jgi:signal transduction histidine kinase